MTHDNFLENIQKHYGNYDFEMKIMIQEYLKDYSEHQLNILYNIVLRNCETEYNKPPSMAKMTKLWKEKFDPNTVYDDKGKIKGSFNSNGLFMRNMDYGKDKKKIEDKRMNNKELEEAGRLLKEWKEKHR